MQDHTHLLTQAFGIYYTYSIASRFNLYNFDDVYLGVIVQDTQAPSIVQTKPATEPNRQSGVRATNFETPGYANENTIKLAATSKRVEIKLEIFEPPTGKPNFETIRYFFDRVGLFANIKIVDTQGRLAKQLINNEVLASEGFFCVRW